MKSKIVVAWSSLWLLIGLTTPAWAKSSEQWFEEGLAKYMASNCAAAMDPLYQATLKKSAIRSRAHLYLAHCQSVFGQGANAAYNLEQVQRRKLTLAADQELFTTLKKTHKADIELANAIYFNVGPYFGVGSTEPGTLKGPSRFYGLSLGASRPTWDVGGLYESHTTDLKPIKAADYTQSMMVLNGGYFVLPSLRIAGSWTSINGSTTQMQGISILGLQTDYYIKPAWSVFGEFYSSNYPKLLATTSGEYKFDVGAKEFVLGLRLPVVNGASAGLNASLSFTSISINKNPDKQAVASKNLDSGTSRFEGVVSAYLGSLTGALTFWAGKEILGVRGRGTTVYNSPELRSGGFKLNLGYAFTSTMSVSGSYSSESYNAQDLTGKYADYKVATTVIAATLIY